MRYKIVADYAIYKAKTLAEAKDIFMDVQGIRIESKNHIYTNPYRISGDWHRKKK